MITENPKFLKILIITAFAIIIPASIIGINFYEKSVSNPRIWDDWTCEEMEKFALEENGVSKSEIGLSFPVTIR